MNLADTDVIIRTFDATAPRKTGRYVWQGLFLLGVALVTLQFLREPNDSLALSLERALCTLTLLLIVTFGWLNGRRRRDRREALARAWESVQLEDYHTAEVALARVLNGPIPTAAERGQAYMTLADACERQGRHESAVRIYERLLVGRIGELGQLQEAQIKLIGAKLQNHELTDAVDLIRRLEQVPMPPPLKALFDLAYLLQQVFMGHHEDAVHTIEERRPLFRRHLSTKAGLGYALFATALHHMGRSAEAAGYWRDATTLIRPDRLVHDYPFLRPTSLAYPAAESAV